MTFDELRARIDTIDDTLVKAFSERMDVVAQISQAKQESDLPVLDVARERQKLADVASKLPPELGQYGYALWSMLFEISRYELLYVKQINNKVLLYNAGSIFNIL